MSTPPATERQAEAAVDPTHANPVAALAAAGAFGPPAYPGHLGYVGHYCLLRLVGVGGMGTVLLARDSETSTLVAVKFLRAAYVGDDRARRQFTREARLLQQLKHPHIMPILEVCEESAVPYFVMPYTNYGSLARRLEAGSPLAERLVVAVAMQVAEALCFTHAKGVIHRDIKPGNILFTTEEEVRVTDFGLACTVFNDSSLDLEDPPHCLGTAPYLSPGVARNEAEDTRCDIYAFGAVLYEMLSGRPPYQGPTPSAIREQIRQGAPPPLVQVNSRVDPGLARIVNGAMARAHRDRYAQMADVLNDLRQIAAGRTSDGPHRAPKPRFRPFHRKSSVLVSLTGCLVTAALALLVFWPRARFRPIAHYVAPLVSSWSTALPVEWGSPFGRQLLVGEGNLLIPYDTQGRRLQPWQCPNVNGLDLKLRLVADATGDGQDEAFVTWSTSSSNLFLSVVTAKRKEITRLPLTALLSASHGAQSDNPGQLEQLYWLASTQTRSGQPALLAVIQRSGPNQQAPSTSSLCCLSYPSGELLWQHDVGPRLHNCQRLDLNGDGIPDFLFGSVVLPAGQAAPKDDPRQASVFAFRDDGKPLWRAQLPGRDTHVLVWNGDGTEQSAIFVWANAITPPASGRDRRIGGTVRRLDKTGNVEASWQSPLPIRSCLAADVNQDGRPELLCSDSEGAIQVLGPNLQPLRRVQISKQAADQPGTRTQPELRLLQAGVFAPGAASPQIIAQSWVVHHERSPLAGLPNPTRERSWQEDLQVLLLDSQLQVLARYPIAHRADLHFDWSIRIADMDDDGWPEILCLANTVTVLDAATASW